MVDADPMDGFDAHLLDDVVNTPRPSFSENYPMTNPMNARI